ncbi:hypothetical protein J2X20_002742 [Pelomonas saccharophila]|uniref:Uncharacterized protein n=1 Tax=Roseateles saccharophilus TaxID=304 RepID=A0ABU1YMK4_ROSSA|nr:hypothetical protein [Roseateles saccharophilus]MDR7270084.1 hypothetical protein [Roseateles saccharophilus]
MRLALGAASLVLCLLSSLAQAQTDSLDQFHRQLGKLPTQHVVHYLKSNLDGSVRQVQSLYFAGPLQLEVLKVENDGRYLGLVEARLDPQTLTESWMRSYNRLEQGVQPLQMALNSDPGQRRLVAAVAKAKLPVQVSHLPAHIYNFDLAGLNATLPLLKQPRADFQVGIVDPDFEFLRQRFKPDGGEQLGGLVDKGVATFKYLGDETLDDVAVHRYEVGGPAFAGKLGTLWVNAQDRLIQRIEHPVPDNPTWTSFRLDRMASRPMTRAEWKAFKVATIRRAQDLRERP